MLSSQDILCEYSPDKVLWFRKEPHNPRLKAELNLPDRQASCNMNGVSWNMYLLYCDHSHLHLSHNKYFWSLLQRYIPIQTCKLQRPKLNFIALSDYSWSEAMYNMSAHQLSQYYYQPYNHPNNRLKIYWLYLLLVDKALQNNWCPRYDTKLHLMLRL